MPTRALTVSEFIAGINTALGVLEDTVVQGEVDEFKIIQNKWVTFKLKDEESSVGCFMTVWQYKSQIEDGMLVRAVGYPTVRNKGFFSFVLRDVQPTGEGALRRAFELLQQKLTAEGLFATERKRPLPRFPQRVALVTSRDAAAYSDFLKILAERHGGLHISFLHAAVQGKDAVTQIIAALEYANTQLADIDAIVLVRGGGSLEDLHAFNDETVVRAVASSRIPTIVGIGHERDISLAELAADIRASTPTNAAELLVKTRTEIALAVDQLAGQLHHAVHDSLAQQHRHIAHTVRTLRVAALKPKQLVEHQLERLRGVRHRLALLRQERRSQIVAFSHHLTTQMRRSLTQREHDMQQIQRLMNSLSPRHTLARGYSITRTTQGTVLKQATQVAAGEAVVIQLAEGEIPATVASGTERQSTLL